MAEPSDSKKSDIMGLMRYVADRSAALVTQLEGMHRAVQTVSDRSQLKFEELPVTVRIGEISLAVDPAYFQEDVLYAALANSLNSAQADVVRQLDELAGAIQDVRSVVDSTVQAAKTQKANS